MKGDDSPPEVLGKKASTQADLRSAIFRAVQVLEERLDEPPSAAELARAAGISKRHFQRVFRAVVGETVAQHSLRLRLERAAAWLRFSTWHIGEIALASGFGTSASFSRGFSRQFGLSPVAYRARVDSIPFLETSHRPRRDRPSPPDALDARVTLEQWPEQRAICLRHYGSVRSVMRPWRELLAWARDAVPDLDDARFFGLWFDYWRDEDDAYRYECAIVPRTAPESIPSPFFERELPSGRVATLPASGTFRDLDRAWHSFSHDWLPNSGLQPAARFAIDEYPPHIALGSTIERIVAGVRARLELRLCLYVQSEPLDI